MLPDVSEEQRQMMNDVGDPLPVVDRATHEAFILIRAEVTPDPLGGFSASLFDKHVTGAGGTVEEALLALAA